MNESIRKNDFGQFWAFYLAAHSRPWTRRLHIFGTLLGLVLVALGIIKGQWELLALAVVIGYGLSWLSHFFIEHNRPATFKHPWWAFRSDLKMFRLWLNGQLNNATKTKSE